MAEKKPVVVDYTEGKYVCGYHGIQVRSALKARIEAKEAAVQQLSKQLTLELGEDAAECTGLLIAMLGNKPGPKARYLYSLVEAINAELDDMHDLEAILRGIVEDYVYKLSLVETRKFGL